MKRSLAVVAIVVVIVGGLLLVAAKRAPKAPPPTTQEIWKTQGIPVETAVVTIGDMEQSVEVTGDIDALAKATLSAKIAGRVSQVLAREGDTVAAGETIVVLDQQDAQANLQNAQAALDAANNRLSQAHTNAKVTRIQVDSAIEQAKASLDAAQARLAVVKKPARSQEQMVAENAVASAKANLDNAEANYKRHQQLLKDGAIAASAFDLAKSQYLVAKAAYKSAEDQLSLVKEGGRREDVRAAQAQVEVAKEQLRAAKSNASQNLLRQEDINQARAGVKQARAALELARQQLSYTYVKSPISGTMASRLIDPGQVISPGQSLGDVVNLASVYLKGEVSETELANIRKGQPVEVRTDAAPDTAFSGHVAEIFPSGSTQSRNFPVRIKIDRADHVLKPGMFARGNIITGVHSGVILVPKDAIEERGGTTMVFVAGDDHKAIRRDVKVVRENTHLVEVASASGLKAGDVVITGGRQNLQDKSLIKVEKGG